MQNQEHHVEMMSVNLEKMQINALLTVVKVQIQHQQVPVFQHLQKELDGKTQSPI